ncbi:hypothetical protein BGZ80_004531 [Entomortierella chlamydospora]|uniref:Ef hand domain-containing protein n=1 Tax=Entomortierella chlamydospora TaxID=101097 RepID=A0A9P6T4J9_9FUNG|nr:hypothetical protein BGZ79_005902 [Entomortierella chlamydospora]KAG0024291.1 hypothetical protein BGZ80_004531 [Entomortierella chlamydospora]
MASFGGPITRDTGTIRRRDITLSAREKQLYGQLWAAADRDNNGFITGADAVPFFGKSGLSPQVLGEIWVLADADNKGVLGQQGFSIALKLIAHAQNGKTPSAALLDTDAPLPHFEGISPGSPVATNLSPIAAQNTGSEPTLTNEDKNKYGGMFIACGPVGGLLDGEKAREVFLKSKLSVDKLSQIWSLADTKQRGSLDITDFTIAMYYIQHTMDGSIKNLPAVLPPSVLKACTGSITGTGLVSSPIMAAQTLNRQATGNNINIHNPTITRQMTGSITAGLTSSPLARQNTGGTSSLFGGSSSSDIPWDVTPEEKAKFDRFFDQLDKNGTGVVGGEEAGKFFLNSRLPETVLAQIWDLADITGSGSLSKDEFAVAMLLINRKNATGAPIPKTLPPSLVPPSLRNRVTSSMAFSQEPIRAMTGTTAQLRRQSFDLLGDGPTLTASPSAAGASHAEKDLISEDLKNKITSETGELASMQNQINNLTNVTGDLQAKRAMLEKNLHVLSAQKQDISIRLNQIKTLHESESRVIKETESAIAVIQPQLIKLREELQVSEQNLSVARANKDEFLLSLAKDQEESNQIKARLQMNNEEIFKLREELEAKKKDTGRQKGLLEIARRQLESSEAEKQKLINEIAQETDKASLATKEVQTRSPAPPAPHKAAAWDSPSPQPPAPRGTRKEPPPPPASRGTNSSFASRATPEVEEAFGIPEALRSPTGSSHSTSSHRSGAPQALVGASQQSTGSTPFDTIAKQTTGSSPFDSIPKQTTGSSPFDSIPKQATGPSPFDSIPKQTTGSSPFEGVPKQGTGSSPFESVEQQSTAPIAGDSSAFFSAQDDLWSSKTQVLGGQAPVAASPNPETPFMIQQKSMSAVEEDPFGSAFPSLNAPIDTKVDFDSAFQGFSTSKSSQGFGVDSVKSAEAFAEAFPDIDAVGGSDEDKSKRVSAFGFEDDFSVTPFSASLEKSKEDDEFPPIVEVAQDESDDSDDENEEKFVQASSNFTGTPDPFQTSAASESGAPTQPIASPSEEPFSTPSNIASPAPTNVPGSSSEPVAPVAPTAVAPTGSATKKLTAADFSEFETSFGGSNDDFDSAFKGVELSASKVSGDTASKISGFDDAFDSFNPSFDDAFGPSSSPFGTTGSQAPAATAASSNAFGTVDLDAAFGGFGVSGNTAGTGAQNNGFDDGFKDFEAQFASSSGQTAPTEVSPTPAAQPSTGGATAPAAPADKIDSTATSAPVPPAVELRGVDELINMGFTRKQAEDALLRYDNVERAANFLLEGGH